MSRGGIYFGMPCPSPGQHTPIPPILQLYTDAAPQHTEGGENWAGVCLNLQVEFRINPLSKCSEEGRGGRAGHEEESGGMRNAGLSFSLQANSSFVLQEPGDSLACQNMAFGIE